MNSQHNLYDVILGQLDQELCGRLCTLRVGDFFVTENHKLSIESDKWKSVDKDCWITLKVQHLSITHDESEDTCIASVPVSVSLYLPSASNDEQTSFLGTIVTEVKKSCHSINQGNLLQMLDDRKVSSQYLMLVKSEATEDSQQSRLKAEAEVDTNLTNRMNFDEPMFCNKELFYPGCFSCDKVDNITCSIQEFYDSSGQNTAEKVQEMVINGLISSFFHPFAITNSKERCFVFRVSDQK